MGWLEIIDYSAFMKADFLSTRSFSENSPIIKRGSILFAEKGSIVLTIYNLSLFFFSCLLRLYQKP